MMCLRLYPNKTWIVRNRSGKNGKLQCPSSSTNQPCSGFPLLISKNYGRCCFRLSLKPSSKRTMGSLSPHTKTRSRSLNAKKGRREAGFGGGGQPSLHPGGVVRTRHDVPFKFLGYMGKQQFAVEENCASASLCRAYSALPKIGASNPENRVSLQMLSILIHWQKRDGAPGRIRTCGLCLRRAALYPLSYGRIMQQTTII